MGAGTKAALTASIAEVAGVDISVVVVRLGLPRRLQSDTAEFSIAYTIIVSANEAVAVVERIASTDLDSATAVVTQHFSNAGINGAVNVVGLSADIAGGDGGDIVKDVLALWIGAGIGGGIGVLFLLLFLSLLLYWQGHSSRADQGSRNSITHFDEHG